MKKTVISLILVLALLCSVFPASVSAAAVDDYTQWKQYDPEWNQAEAWIWQEYPDATIHTMRGAGCLVTSIAMLLRHYDVIENVDLDAFNPWICNETLKAAGAFNSEADLIYGYVENAYPGFVYQDCIDYDLSALKNLMDDGYACIVKVSGRQHYVAVNTIVDDDVVIMDPGSDATSLSAYGGGSYILYFAPTPVKREYADYCEEYVSYGKILVTKKAYLMNQPCSSGTDSSSTYIETVGKNKELIVTGLYMNTQGNLWYRVIAPASGEMAYIPSSHTVWKGQLISDVTISDVSAPTTLAIGDVFCIRGNVESEYNTLEKVSAYVYSGVNAAGTPATGREVSVNAKNYELYNSAVDAGVEFNYLEEGGYSYVIRATTGKCHYAVNEKTVGELESAEVMLHMSTFTVGDVPDFAVNTYDARLLNVDVQQSGASRNWFSSFGKLFRK